jgi:hypothetical protein
MIYSAWRPDTGGFDYFEHSGAAGLSDDLPTPRMPRETPLGVPSVEAGRRVPSGSSHIGDGDHAVGMVAPADIGRLGGVAEDGDSSPAWWFLAGAAAVAAVWAVDWSRRRG